MTTYSPDGWPADLSDSRHLAGARGVLLNASRDPDAKLTFLVDSPPRRGRGRPTALAVKIPVSATAGDAVEREARNLVSLRRLPLGDLLSTVPRYVESLQVEGRPVLVSTALPGTPMAVRYHSWLHTARPGRVRADLQLAAAWLGELHEATSGRPVSFTWPQEVRSAVQRRWDGDPMLPGALARLDRAVDQLAGWQAPRGVVHGDYWFGNVLVDGDRVSGVVDWESADVAGWPVRDLVRFAISYALYLDRHTPVGHRVVGHPRLRRAGWGAGVVYAFTGRGWLPSLVRSFQRDGLERVGLPPLLWWEIALVGLAEVAASANEEAFARHHLALLVSLPRGPRSERRR